MCKSLSLNTLDTSDSLSCSAVLVLGRDDLRPCTANDREYLAVMMQAFVPRVLATMAPIASEYLPGDARNLCIEVANHMELIENDFNFQTFIAMYRGRYVQKPLPQRAVVELCLLHVLKMPFELNSAIQNSLIRYWYHCHTCQLPFIWSGCGMALDRSPSS